MKSGWKAFFPNLLTSLNLLAGCVALVSVFNGKYVDMAIFVVAALVFDLLDGLVARALGVSSPFGRELDSLADMVTFGLVPGVVMYQLFCSSDFASDSMDGSLPVYLVWIPFLITVFSALRLAKFNLDTRQTDHFIGLPTPANTIWIISLPLISVMMPGEFDFLIKSGWVLSGLTLVSCWLLVAELPMLSFKLKSFSLRKYPGQFILVAASIVFAVLFSVAAAPIIILFYVLLSIFFDYRSKQVS